jgi:hypothetical protein
MSDPPPRGYVVAGIEGKVTRVGASECGQRTSFKISCRTEAVQFAPLARRKAPELN